MSIRATKRQAVSPSSEQARASDGAEVPPDEVPDYRTPPPKRVFFVRVRYRYLGRGQPLPLDTEDLDDGS